jgi:hypothetical protein
VIGKFSTVPGLLRQRNVDRDTGLAQIDGIAELHRRLEVVPSQAAFYDGW